VTDFDGQGVLVTGGSRGIGRAIALLFAQGGARVAVHYASNEKAAQDVLAALPGTGHVAVRADLGAGTAHELVAETLDQLGRIDVLVNNAALYGSLSMTPFEKLDEAEWDAAMNVNVKGLWQCAKAVAPAMKKQNSGSIINISSLAAIYGLPNCLHYTASKAAVIGITRGLARELGRYNIRVNTIAPNVVNTDATSEIFKDKRDKIVDVTTAQQAIRRSLEPEDIVGSVLFLGSDLSTLTTGQTLMVDGGTVLL